MRELTAKQKAFIEELPKQQWNATKAALAAGYAAKGAAVIACRLQKDPRVAAAIQEVRERYTTALECKTDITVEEIVSRLNRVYQEAIDKGRLSDANKALDLLGRYKGMYADQTGQSGPDLNIVIMADDDCRREVFNEAEGACTAQKGALRDRDGG
ncbi:MAG: terminase small subunit [Planctomycetota bacterium]